MITLLAVAMLAGCAEALVKQTAIVSNDGTKFYLLSSLMTSSERSRNASVRDLKDRAHENCPSGYVLGNEDRQPVSNPAGFYNGAWELFWQIKCNAEQPAS